jgi:hypothetical protein
LLASDNLIQSLDNLSQFFWSGATDHFTYSFDRERSNLTDFHQGFLREASGVKFKRQWKPCPLRLARERNGDYGSGAVVENVLAQN